MRPFGLFSPFDGNLQLALGLKKLIELTTGQDVCLEYRQHDLVVRIASRHPANASQTNKKFICPFTVFDEVNGQCFVWLGIKSA